MSNLDYLLLFLMLGYVWVGYSVGLIQSVGSLVGVVVGVLGASRWFVGLTPWIEPLVGGQTLVAAVISFAAIFLLVNRGVGFLFAFVNQVFHLASVIPGIRVVDRLGGLVFGFLEGLFAIGITLQFLSRLPVGRVVIGGFEHSTLVPYFTNAAGWLVGLLPAVLLRIPSILA